MKNISKYILCFIVLMSQTLIQSAIGSGISWQHLPSNRDIIDELKPAAASLFSSCHDSSEILDMLVEHLKHRASERYYFSWKEFSSKFNNYEVNYPSKRVLHDNLARYHMSRYAPETSWQLPFINLLGEPVTAYELRHLARQQKSFDMALMYHYSEMDSGYPDYFVRQVADLNRAFFERKYDDKGNGIYESYRAGKRIHNWLFCYNAYMTGSHFGPEDQLLLIKTFLHHGAQLQKRTAKFRSGNHHTKGLVALFEIAVMFSDFRISELWKAQALDGLRQHIVREVNDDGFQFERSVHYHMGDIENYFRVYQLAKLNSVVLPDVFESQFRKMFEALVLLAQPNNRLPVLQDDTDSPFSENNHIDNVMTIATLVFGDPIFKYFATDEIPPDVFWLLRPELYENLNVEYAEPTYGSTALTSTGYYCMRNGWDKNSLYMTISAGLSHDKPDHQHGDMLGVVAYANGHEILPNYQVRYKFSDYITFKNSWVKNVALVDSLPLGQKWKPNSGNSGFGKWTALPVPEILHWNSRPDYDYFIGSHSAYDSLNVSYYREVLFIKDGFWIVRDHFAGESEHTYQQVWQGHYSTLDHNYAHADFKDNTGLEIIQLNDEIDAISMGKHRSKGNIVFSDKGENAFIFTTILYPYRNDKLGPTGKDKTVVIKNWRIEKNDNHHRIVIDQVKTDARVIITNKCRYMILYDFSFIDIEKDSERYADYRTVMLEFIDGNWSVTEKFKMD